MCQKNSDKSRKRCCFGVLNGGFEVFASENCPLLLLMGKKIALTFQRFSRKNTKSPKYFYYVEYGAS